MLTTTAFGAGGMRKLHTQLVRCAGCKQQFAFRLARSPDGADLAIAEDRATHQEQVLVEWPET
jgi:hypothetical protein